MVLHSGSGDGAKNKATKTTVKHAKPTSAALAAGLREAQKDKAATKGGENKSPLDLLDSDSDEESDALCAAALEGKPNAVRKALAAPGVDPNVVGSQGLTPLFIASQNGKAEIASMLLTAKADPGLACFGGATPLYISCSRNHSDVCKLLVKAGAPVDAQANNYYTPLLAAVSHGCEDAARALLAAGASVHARSDKWGSYLHAAAKNGKVDMVRLLLGFEADLSVEHEGLTPLGLAEQRKHTETASVLRKAADRKAKLAALSAEAAGGGGGANELQAMVEAAAAEAAQKAADAAETVREPTAEEVAAAEAAEAAATRDREKKAAKRARQKAKKKEQAEACEGERHQEQMPIMACDAAEGGGAKVKSDGGAPETLLPPLGSPEYTSPPPSLAERRADALLAERALAELSVEAAKKMARAVAVEEVQAAAHKDEVSGKLRALAGEMAKVIAVEEVQAAAHKDEVSEKIRQLAGGAAKEVARAAAVEGVAAAARIEEVSDRLRALAEGAAKSQATAQAVVEFSCGSGSITPTEPSEGQRPPPELEPPRATFSEEVD